MMSYSNLFFIVLGFVVDVLLKRGKAEEKEKIDIRPFFSP